MSQSFDLLQNYDGDPVGTINGEYYFADETWSDLLGPFPSEEVARQELKKYAEAL